MRDALHRGAALAQGPRLGAGDGPRALRLDRLDAPGMSRNGSRVSGSPVAPTLVLAPPPRIGRRLRAWVAGDGADAADPAADQPRSAPGHPRDRRAERHLRFPPYARD